MTQVDPAFYASGIVLPGPTSAANATGQIPVWNDTGFDAWLGTWDGTFLVLPALAVTDLTATRIPYASTSGRLADNANLVWDNSNSRMGIGASAPAARLHVIATSIPFRVGYDTSNYMTVAVASDGMTTFDGAGSNRAFTLNKYLIVNDGTYGGQVQVQNGGVTKGTFAVSGATDAGIIGSVANDMYFRSPSGAILFSSNNGSFASLYLSATAGVMRQQYSASAYVTHTVSSGGDLTVAPTGGQFAIQSVASHSSPIFVIREVSSTPANREQFAIDTAWIDSTDATRKARVTLNAYDTAIREVARGWGDGAAGRMAITAPASAPTDAHLAASQISFYLDESGHNLIVRVKYANGTTLKTATIALT